MIDIDKGPPAAAAGADAAAAAAAAAEEDFPLAALFFSDFAVFLYSEVASSRR